jgi:hypothetical protein
MEKALRNGKSNLERLAILKKDILLGGLRDFMKM